MDRGKAVGLGRLKLRGGHAIVSGQEKQMPMNSVSMARRVPGLFALAMTLVSCVSEVPSKAPQAEKKPGVAWVRLWPSDFQSFVGNWDIEAHPVLVANPRNPSEFGALFHPAPVMGSKRPFAPEPSFWESHQVLVAARVMDAPKDPDKVFSVESLSENGAELTLKYLYARPDSTASFTIGYYLALAIPRKDYSRILFVENGEAVGALTPSNGAWCAPPLSD